MATKTATTAAADTGANAVLSEADAAWAARDDRAKLLRAIELWEGVAKADAKNADVRVKLSRAYYFLVDGHIALDDGDVNEQKLVNHQKGVDHGEAALLLVDPQFGEKMRAGVDFKDAVKAIDKPAIPAVYWYCTNLSRFALAKGFSARLFYKDRVKAAMDRIAELDPTYFHAGTDRYFGAFYSALPGIAGKDLGKSGIHFDKAIALAPHYLANKLLKADFLAVELDDKAMYEKLLNEVSAAPDGDDPDYAPENRAAKRHAKKLLAKIGERF
ncbi:TRAP transporter TatT component family protein [Myxococcota bacterium]|nr:TRAP transporter TatT component family protein [Myxococcota bacterium]